MINALARRQRAVYSTYLPGSQVVQRVVMWQSMHLTRQVSWNLSPMHLPSTCLFVPHPLFHARAISALLHSLFAPCTCLCRRVSAASAPVTGCVLGQHLDKVCFQQQRLRAVAHQPPLRTKRLWARVHLWRAQGQCSGSVSPHPRSSRTEAAILD